MSAVIQQDTSVHFPSRLLVPRRVAVSPHTCLPYHPVANQAVRGEHLLTRFNDCQSTTAQPLALFFNSPILVHTSLSLCITLCSFLCGFCFCCFLLCAQHLLRLDMRSSTSAGPEPFPAPVLRHMGTVM